MGYEDSHTAENAVLENMMVVVVVMENCPCDGV